MCKFRTLRFLSPLVAALLASGATAVPLPAASIGQGAGALAAWTTVAAPRLQLAPVAALPSVDLDAIAIWASNESGDGVGTTPRPTTLGLLALALGSTAALTGWARRARPLPEPAAEAQDALDSGAGDPAFESVPGDR